METIEVGYKRLDGLPGAVGDYHMYIVYTDSNGNKWGTRAGSGDVTIVGALTLGMLPDAPYGTIKTETREYADNVFADYDDNHDDPLETIASGVDLSEEWARLTQAMTAIGNEVHTYQPLSQNSNTTVNEALRRAGLPETTLDDVYYAPGADFAMDGGWLAEIQDASGRGVIGFAVSLGRVISDVGGLIRDQFQQAQAAAPDPQAPQGPVFHQGYIDPLVLDLDGNGIQTLAKGSGAYFDYANDGFAESTGWASPDDGFLVRDLNSNGTIDSGEELFGDQTLLSDGTLAANGFVALAALDSNADAKVDASDAAWSELRVWRDANSDGFSSANELLTMEQAGVESINTEYASPNTDLGDGNTLAQEGTFTREDGLSGQAGSLLFDRNTANSFATAPVTMPAEAQGLPDLDGFGTVYSLQQAMARAPSLQPLVEGMATMSAMTGYDAYLAAFQEVLNTWTGAGTVAAGSRGSFVDAKHLAVLEAFMGEPFIGSDGTGNPNSTAGAQLEAAYSQLAADFAAQFIAQAQLKPILEAVGIGFSPETGELILDMAGVAAALASTHVANPDEATAQLAWLMKAAPALGLSDITGWGSLGTALELAAPSTPLPALYRFMLANPDANLYAGTAVADEAISLDLAAVLIGGDGNDVLVAATTSSFIDGGAGDDALQGVSGENYLIGGTGNDTLSGGAGEDTYIFNLGDGQDIVLEHDYATASDVIDVLRFGEGIAATDIRAERSGYDLVLRHSNGTDQVTIHGWYSTADSTRKLEQVTFADGTVWDTAFLTQEGQAVRGTDEADVIVGQPNVNHDIRGLGGNDTLTGWGWADVLDGGDGDDTLYGRDGYDTLRGGAGNDTLFGGIAGSSFSFDNSGNTYLGGAGNDTLYGTNFADAYRFNLGDGQDRILEYTGSTDPSVVDVLQFGEGIAAADIRGVRSGNDLLLCHANGEDQVTIGGWYASTTNARKLEQVTFADGTVWDTTQIQDLVSELWGSAAGETLVATGNIHTIVGGKGNDYLRGTAVHDVFRFNHGDGVDRVYTTKYGGAATDTLVFEDSFIGTTLTASKSEWDLLITAASGDKVTLSGWFATSNANKADVQAPDGTLIRAGTITSYLSAPGNDNAFRIL